jgi:hypothetical protein
MRNRSVTFAVLSFLISGVAAAQTYEVGVGGSYTRFGHQLLGSISNANKEDDDTKLKGRIGYGARLTLNTRGYYGHEIAFFLNSATLSTKVRPDDNNANNIVLRTARIKIQEASYNFLMYMMPRGERFRPFITGGAQMTKYPAPRIEEWAVTGTRTYGANYGGGIKIRMFPHALFRADFRHCFGGKPYDLPYKDPNTFSGGILQHFQGSLGISIGF